MSLAGVIRHWRIQPDDPECKCKNCCAMGVTLIDPDTCEPVAPGDIGGGDVTVNVDLAPLEALLEAQLECFADIKATLESINEKIC